MWITKFNSTLVTDTSELNKLTGVEPTISASSSVSEDVNDSSALAEQVVDSDQPNGTMSVVEDLAKRGEEVEDSNQHVGKQNTNFVNEQTAEEATERDDKVSEQTAADTDKQKDEEVIKEDESSKQTSERASEQTTDKADNRDDDKVIEEDEVSEQTSGEALERTDKLDKETSEQSEEEDDNTPDQTTDETTEQDDEQTSGKTTDASEQTTEESNIETSDQSEDPTPSKVDSMNLSTKDPSSKSQKNTTKPVKSKRKAKSTRPKFGSRFVFSKKGSSVQNVVLDLTIPAIPPPPSSTGRLSLVLFTTADASHFYPELKVLNILQMFDLFQREFNFKGIVFTHTPSIRNAATKLHIQVISDFPVNRYHMPIVGAMYTKAVELFDSEYYGYINSDILVSVNLFELLELCRLNAEQGNINLRHEIAGRVSEVPSYDKLIATDLVAYTKYLRNLSRQVKALRHGHSADYFIFSRYFNFSDYKPVVIGRKKVDNYLLWIPHQSPVTTEDLKYTRNRWKTKGHLIDTSYAVRGIHLGYDNYLSREIRDRLGASDKYWNLKYFTNIDGHHASLMYSHYTFRYYRGALNVNYITKLKKNRERYRQK
ncbi:hypothetical protein WA171_003242 [Blastocystis sp. BT1]